MTQQLSASPPPRSGLWAWWHATPLYLRILYACIAGAIVGVGLRELGAFLPPTTEAAHDIRYLQPLAWAEWLKLPSRLIVRHLLTALAAPLVRVAVVQALMQAQIPKGSAVKLIGLLLLNTTVAILIGLTVANTLKPGARAAIQAKVQPGE